MSKFKNIIFPIALLLILVGAILFSFDPVIAPYILSIGVSMYGAIVFTTPYPGKNIRGKRLFNIQVFVVLLMAVSCYLMFISYNQWVMMLLLAAILMVYSNFMIAKVWKEEQEQE